MVEKSYLAPNCSPQLEHRLPCQLETAEAWMVEFHLSLERNVLGLPVLVRPRWAVPVVLSSLQLAFEQDAGAPT
eukprot:CAMPEP_0170177420 /NCGR_PEP_ID=MMETSP0040_2-20121228/10076_1 /TAXON_ID=641309 /ORGANISM="Lotharella oceanica, Strain CCMP622" /LENGTH=73 /DNA_ID=CAMNT_0010420053 /DNA_START=438 /DNA_END=659 /DNA_ORIENTATION=+